MPAVQDQARRDVSRVGATFMRTETLVALSLLGLLGFVGLVGTAAWVTHGSAERDERREMAAIRVDNRVVEYRAQHGVVPPSAESLPGPDRPPSLFGIYGYRALDSDHFEIDVLYEAARHPTHEHPLTPRWAHPAGLVHLDFDARPFEGPMTFGTHDPYAIGNSPGRPPSQRR